MKKLLLAVLLCLFAPAAWAQCTSNSACATTPCRWAAAGTWTNGAGCVTPPTGTEPWTIQAGHTVTTDAASETGGVGTVAGTLVFDPGTATRDASGFRNLVITTTGANTGITCSSTGKIVLRQSDRLRFDTTAGVGRIGFSHGCVLDFRGATHETTVSAIVAADDDAAPCGNASPIGREWTVTPASGIGLAKVGRRVIFKSGPLVTRAYEIVAVSSPTLTLCSHFADGSSLGQRLTPYGTANGADPGAGTAGHHTVPTVTAGLDACTGAGAPFPCCSGPGAGTCPDGPDPEVGDAIEIVDDFWIDESAGTAGWNFVDNGDGTTNCSGAACSGADPLPIVQYGNLDGIGGGGAGTGVIAGQFVVRSANQFTPDFIGNNLHGWQSDYGLVWKGNKNFAIKWNQIHDSLRAAGSSDAYCQINVHQNKTSENGVVSTPVSNVDISYNSAWRTKQCAIQINDADNGSETHADFQASLIKVNNNLVYEFGGVAAGIATEGIHVHSCTNCQVRRNVIYEGYNADATAGTGIKLGGTADNDGTDVSDNWLVNLGGYGIRCDDDTGAPTMLAGCAKVGFVNNYISHTRDAGGRGGRWYSFINKNFGLDNAAGSAGIRNPLVAYGGFVAVDEAVAALAVCTASASRCGRSGLSWGLHDGNRNQTSVAVSDVIIGQMSNNGATRFGMDNDGFGGLAVADFGGTIANVTNDHRSTGTEFGRTYNFSSSNPAVPVTWTFTDLLVAYKLDDVVVNCTTAGNVTETLGNTYSLKTDSTTESGGAYDSDCTSTGTLTRPATVAWNNRDGFNYGVRVGAPEYTAGTGGLAMGARAFRFSTERMEAAWGDILTFDNDMPVNFSTGTSNADTDGDGVMDLHDNCDSTYNPSQWDVDGDGKGCVCDSGETCS